MVIETTEIDAFKELLEDNPDSAPQWKDCAVLIDEVDGVVEPSTLILDK